ncbi:hypothetical protein [Streptomyces enissocaesilis]|uniref:SpdB2 protein n=1 Tax=Streptomyces enissocaesilis TaxID=332589 RepID=A0ABN3WYL2_9ACTN
MTAPPQVNGRKRPAMPLLGDWQPITVGQPAEPAPAAPPAEPGFDPVALAEADAIRARTEAETEARRIAAEAEADAVRVAAEAEAERQRIANERAAMRLAREKAENDAKVAEANRKKEEAERLAAAAREKAEAEERTEAQQEQAEEAASQRWRKAAIGFAVACGIVALPVQISAFWDPNAWWLAATPVFLEGGAWVVLAGAAAAVAARRPHWHFRLIAWVLAFVAAGVNLWHGLAAFDTATACATAFASLAGPGVWDLHEHGRIRKRDGRLSWRQARQQAKEQKKREARAAAREASLRKAEEGIAAKLTELRQKEYPDEWKYALRIAAALGETTVTDAVWERTWDDLHAAKPSYTASTISARNAAAIRLQRVTERAPDGTPGKTTNTQRAIQVKAPPRRSSYRPTPPRRTKNDTPKFHPVARALAADAKRQSAAATEEQK